MSASVRILSFTLLFILCLMASNAFAQLELGTACEPYGSVTIGGQPAANNLVVIAYVGEIELARTHTNNGQYSLYIPKDDPDTPQRDGYRDGEVITIRVNSNPCLPSFEAFAGRQRRDLEVTTLDIRLETWGRIKALFR
jgi:hypothetical protein